MSHITDLRAAVDAARHKLANYEIDPDDHAEFYDDLLTDCYSFAGVGGPFEHMNPADVLKECDPVAYREGLLDYVNGIDDAPLQELEEALADAEEALADAEEEAAEEEEGEA